ncbi:hypothetical protein [Rhizobium sp.]|uniref:hypothetical protein n=1 Tax=Rhizobium sp. TaxID=391 RepID=UPI00289DCF73
MMSDSMSFNLIPICLLLLIFSLAMGRGIKRNHCWVKAFDGIIPPIALGVSVVVFLLSIIAAGSS